MPNSPLRGRDTRFGARSVLVTTVARVDTAGIPISATTPPGGSPPAQCHRRESPLFVPAPTWEKRLILGRTSFTRVRKKRFVDKSQLKSWITVNYEAAKREYHALTSLEGLSVAFPKAVASNRSTVLLEQVSGVRLSQRPELDDPHTILVSILKAARIAFNEGGLVNGDLSEYNILTDGSRVWLIDWPQAVPASHPNAGELLGHDVRAVVRFFRRAYRVAADEERSLEYVAGRSGSLE